MCGAAERHPPRRQAQHDQRAQFLRFPPPWDWPREVSSGDFARAKVRVGVRLRQLSAGSEVPQSGTLPDAAVSRRKT